MKGKIVLLPIDSTRRDLEWRVFLAAQLAKAGIHSVIMDNRVFRRVHRHSYNCLLLARVREDHDILTSGATRKTKVFYLHDEGAFYLKAAYLETVRRIYPQSLFKNPMIEKIFFWGRKQMTVFKDDPSKHKFVVSGYPRFDLCRSEYDWIDKKAMRLLKEKYGEYILICSRFAAANKGIDDPHILGKRMLQLWARRGDTQGDERESKLSEMFDYWARTVREFSDFVSAAAKLAMDFPQESFIYRPHPAESEAFYKEPFDHFPNLHVSKEGDVRPAIRASKAVIHSECTTSIEASAMQKPLVNFRPQAGHMDELSVCGLTNVGASAYCYADLKKQLRKALDGDLRVSESQEELQAHLANIPGPRQSCSILLEEIVAYFERQSEQSALDTRALIFKGSYHSMKNHVQATLSSLRPGAASEKVGVSGSHYQEGKKVKLAPQLVESLWAMFGGDSDSLSNYGGVWICSPDGKE